MNSETVAYIRHLLIFLGIIVQSFFVQSQIDKQDYYEEKVIESQDEYSKMLYMDTLLDYLPRTDINKAKEYCRQFKLLADKLHDSYYQIKCFYIKGNIAYAQTDYPEAQRQFLKGKAAAKKYNFNDLQAFCLSGLSLVYTSSDHLDEAEKAIRECIKIREENEINYTSVNAYQILAGIEYAQGNLQEAKQTYLKALSLLNVEDNPDPVLALSLSNNIASISFKEKNYAEAQNGFLKSLSIAKKYRPDVHRGISVLYFNIGLTYKSEEQYVTAIAYMDSSLFEAKLAESIGDIMNAYNMMSSIYELQGNYKASLEALRLYIDYKDSIINEKNLNSLNELKEKYNVKEYQDSLQFVMQLNNQLEKNSRLTKGVVSAILVVICFLIVAIFLYMRNKKLKAEKSKAEVEQQLLRSQMNPHFIFNSLNSIQRLYIEGKLDQANDYVADFSSLLRSILINSVETTISLKEEIELTETYMNLEKMRTDEIFNYEIKLAEDIVPEIIRVPPLMFQPFVENAIWHGLMPLNRKGLITISVVIRDNMLECRIIDNGIGVKKSKQTNKIRKHTSKGIQIMEKRLGGKRLLIEENEEGGTYVEFKIPVNYD